MIGRQLFSFQTVHSQKRPVSGIFCLLQPLQAIFHQNPVLPCQVHDISHCGHCRKFRQIQKLLPGNSFLPVERFRQTPGHSRAAQLFKGIPAVRLLGIYDHIRWRKNHRPASIRFLLIGNVMVVGNDHRHTQLFCKGNLLCRRDSIVAGDDRIDSRLLRIPYQVLVDTVSVLHAVGNYRVGLGAAAPESCN